MGQATSAIRAATRRLCRSTMTAVLPTTRYWSPQYPLSTTVASGGGSAVSVWLGTAAPIIISKVGFSIFRAFCAEKMARSFSRWSSLIDSVVDVRLVCPTSLAPFSGLGPCLLQIVRLLGFAREPTYVDCCRRFNCRRRRCRDRFRHLRLCDIVVGGRPRRPRTAVSCRDRWARRARQGAHCGPVTVDPPAILVGLALWATGCCASSRSASRHSR